MVEKEKEYSILMMEVDMKAILKMIILKEKPYFILMIEVDMKENLRISRKAKFM